MDIPQGYRGFALGWLVLTCFLCHPQVGALAHQSGVDRQGVYLAPGWGKLSFDAPQPGTYTLPVIDQAASGKILNSDGSAMLLDDFLGEKITLLSFIYRTCDDVNGCPLSTMVLHKIGTEVSKQPQLRDKLRLLTLSFDPVSDTPQAMQEFGNSILSGSEMDWHFLTTNSESEIRPILEAYRQSVIADVQARPAENNDESGRAGASKKFSHILRVYLIDRRKRVRNIYSLSFLHPDILINDVKTLLLEEGN